MATGGPVSSSLLLAAARLPTRTNNGCSVMRVFGSYRLVILYRKREAAGPTLPGPTPSLTRFEAEGTRKATVPISYKQR
jgi:hypothetical protein